MATTPAAAAAAAAADFANPIYMDEPTSAAAGSSSSSPANGAAAASSDPSLNDVSVIDLNDPNLLSAELDTNPDIDPYAAPPPLPDGRYRVKCKQIDVKGPDGQPARYTVKLGKDGKPPYAYTALELTVIDPAGKLDGLKVYDRFVSTMQQRNGGVPLVWIQKCLGVTLPAKSNAKQILDSFFKVIGGEPELEIETVWEGGLDEADRERFETAQVKQPRVLGQHRFPQKQVGGVMQSVPDLKVQTALGEVNVHAQVRVNGYHPLKK